MNEVIRNIVEPLLKPDQYLLDISGDMQGNYFRIVVDSEQHLTLEDTTKLTRSIKNSDQMNDNFPSGYRLEVTTPGVDCSLEFPFQYKKNINRELKVLMHEEESQRNISGKIISADDSFVNILYNGEKVSIRYDQIKKANVKVSFN